MTADETRKHFKQITRPGSLKGEPEEAERAKIEVLSEIAAQLAELNSQIANLSKHSASPPEADKTEEVEG